MSSQVIHLPARSSSGFPEDQQEVIKATCFPVDMTGREKELAHCLAIARHYQLNPLLGEIRFVQSANWERGRKVWTVKPLVGRDGLISLAHRNGQFGGIKTKVEFKPWPHFNRANSRWELLDQPVATTEVYRRDSEVPTVVSVGFWEYACREDGSLPEYWSTLGVTMTCKVAESQALRKAFNLSGLYAPEEMGAGFVDDAGAMHPVAPSSETSPPANSSETPPAPEPPQTKKPPRAETLEERLARARTTLTRRFGFQDCSDREADILNGRFEVEVDSIIIRRETAKTATILAWVPPSSPNSAVLADYGFVEDTASQWWSLTLTNA